VEYNSQKFSIVQPDFSQLAQIEQIYQEALSKASLLGCLTYEETLDVLLYDNVWLPSHQKELDDSPHKIEDLQVELYNSFINFKKQDMIRKQLSNIRNRVDKLTEILNNYFVFTAEAIANSERLKLTLWLGLRDEDDRPLADKTTNISLINDSFLNHISHQYINSKIDSHELREVSKCNQWKLKWLNYKSLSSFPINTSLMTDEQEILVMWSRYYDNIVESSECPPQTVIEDNDMLDGWATLQNRRNNKEKTNIGMGSNAKEMFIVADTPEDAQRVHALNDTYGEMIRKQKLALVTKKGNIEDQNLPDSRREIISQAMEQESQKMRR
jgi:hypothetical protein